MIGGAWQATVYGVASVGQDWVTKYRHTYRCIVLMQQSLVTWAFLVVWLVKSPPAMWEAWVRSLGWEDPLEKGKGYLLQYFGPENSMDWTIHGIAKSWTQLRDFHFTTSATCSYLNLKLKHLKSTQSHQPHFMYSIHSHMGPEATILYRYSTFSSASKFLLDSVDLDKWRHVCEYLWHMKHSMFNFILFPLL